ncbi:hypothetical protein [Simiduia aestuariiviva]|uniref:Outer membrane lipoprotein-sorting protein n=1 Tax=Simiduia aestuariiviva TaxID=1510459 RepID=A0A839UW53_9GAMM|nr:hypothetical protein [Simiduia aestuariiviva]MBB3169587.1 outer membrane lipoprotein-sorting protein [Simiduia aestuariiviva]
MATRMLFAALALVAAPTFASGLSQSEARALCDTQVSERQADQSDFKFRRNSMSDYRRGVYTFMYNYRAQSAGDTVSRKVKCVIEKDGGAIQTLEVEAGRWNF